MSVTEQLLAKREECSRREQQPPETRRRVLTDRRVNAGVVGAAVNASMENY